MRKRCLKFAITDTRRRWFRLRCHCDNIRRSLNDYNTSESQLREVEFSIERYTTSLRPIYIKKLKWIIKNQVKRKLKRIPLSLTTTVIGDITIPPYVHDILTMGPSCAVNKPCRLIDMAPSVEPLFTHLQPNEGQHLRMNYVSTYFRQRRTHKATEQRLMYLKVERTRLWLKDNSLTCTREDKTKKIVIMPNSQYDDMLNHYKTTSGAIPIDTDPTYTLHNRLATLLRRKDFPTCWKCKFLSNPSCPPLYAYIKTHKQPIAIRPMVDKISSPLTPFEKKLAAWCNRFLLSYPLTSTSAWHFIQDLFSYNLESDDMMLVADYINRPVNFVRTCVSMPLPLPVRTFVRFKCFCCDAKGYFPPCCLL